MAAIQRSRTGIILSLIGLALGMGFITWVVYVSGTDSIAVHFYYLPIIWAAFTFGDRGAIVVSVLAGLVACGPWMPAETAGEVPVAQDLLDIVLRVLIFYVVGMAASRLSHALNRRITEAQTLYEVARSITSSLRIRQVLGLITDHAMRVMDAKACSIRLLDEEAGELELAATAGLNEEYWRKGPVRVPSSPIDEEVLQGEIGQIYNVRTDPRFQYPEAAQQAGLTSVLTVPLRTKDKILGVVRIYSKDIHRFSQGEVDLLTAFADQASVAIENAELYEDIRANYYATVRTLMRAIEAKDRDTYSHSERVTDLLDELAQEVGTSEERRELLRFGSLLHDVGKIGLEHQDMTAMDNQENAAQVFYRMHPLIGQSILMPVSFLQPVLGMVTHHHESWDGSGFPEGLAAEAIPYEARMVAICDAYDRLINPHSPNSQPSLPPGQALQEILAGAGTRFDPALVAAFRRTLTRNSPQGEDFPDQ